VWEIIQRSHSCNPHCAACEQAELLAVFLVPAQSAIFFSSSIAHGNQSGRQKCHKTAHALQAVAAWLLQLVLKKLLKFYTIYESRKCSIEQKIVNFFDPLFISS